jgi:hypothetical protein
MHPTKASALPCGANSYGPDTNRRVISVRLAFGLPDCS